uniref:Uncharacterized protein n=1 Tax=Rhizophora mucronata TaxID=61149 RepID=A0A2P2MXI7_RHIMU
MHSNPLGLEPALEDGEEKTMGCNDASCLMLMKTLAGLGDGQ